MASNTLRNPRELHNLKNFIDQITTTLPSSIKISTSIGDSETFYNHYENSLIFNTRIQTNPFVIVYCENELDVITTYNAATKNELPIRVRAGGHDHEGECSGTNTIVIDVSKINHIKVDPKTKIASIGPGNKFIRLTTELAKEDVMIPHGTCATVGIAGFTMGGGWGPWTRENGMCCESLVGVDILLGNGEIVKLDVDKNGKVPELLWALRGGGGMSYGIVTELRIQTFPLPPALYRFELEWNCYEDISMLCLKETIPTIKVLKNWERLIQSDDTPSLVGTNFKINGLPWEKNKPIDVNTIAHNCILYGYWKGDKASLDAFIKKEFTGDLAPCWKNIEAPTGADYPKDTYGLNLMNSWDRESLPRIQTKMGFKNVNGIPFKPDEDKPAPHKITSRLVNKEGLGYEGKNGYEQLLKSLTSDLILKGNRTLGLFTYVTLGAIAGDFYKKHPNGNGSAFPYKDKLYTIQYQCWWNAEGKEIEKEQDSFVYDRTNRALDWIEKSREIEIQNTSGAFISFKDNSIPTETYFSYNYDKLKEIKINYSKDEYNHFRTRKTII